ncbi:MAG TPA: hypothetical protein VHP36_01240 [Chitinispirillaceae bacterium]|nr:hypothetical protein [Chitinispirillaceae bacterium]
MKQNILLLFIVFFIIETGNADAANRDIPEGLYDALYSKLEKDLKQELSSFGFDTTIDIKEIDPGVPVENYRFRGIKQFDSIDIDAPIMSLVESAGTWEFFLRARGNYIISILFDKLNGNWVWAGTGGRRPAWEEIREAYPESTGIRPVKIQGARGWGYVHFPHINNRNLTLLAEKKDREKIQKQLKNTALNNESVQMLQEQISIMPESWDSASLVDSRITLQFFKKEIKRAQEMKAEYRRRFK